MENPHPRKGGARTWLAREGFLTLYKKVFYLFCCNYFINIYDIDNDAIWEIVLATYNGALDIFR